MRCNCTLRTRGQCTMQLHASRSRSWNMHLSVFLRSHANTTNGFCQSIRDCAQFEGLNKSHWPQLTGLRCLSVLSRPFPAPSMFKLLVNVRIWERSGGRPPRSQPLFRYTSGTKRKNSLSGYELPFPVWVHHELYFRRGYPALSAGEPSPSTCVLLTDADRKSTRIFVPIPRVRQSNTFRS